MSSGLLEQPHNRHLPLSMWLMLFLSVGIHAVVLADLSFRSHSGNDDRLQTMRVRLDFSDTPVAKSRQVKQKQQQVAVAKPEAEMTPLPEKKPPPKEENQQARQQQAASEVAGRAGEQRDKRLRYIETLLRQIESKKYYPSVARRRGIEGRIHVQFTLYEADDIRNVEIDGDSGLLKRVSREALLAALPFTPPPEGVSFPLAVEYIMEFSLD
jgi:TonB family protein